jgi:signal transduction histidine kinase
MPPTSGSPAAPLGPRGLATILGWRRVAFTLALAIPIGLALGHHWKQGPLVGLIRMVPLGIMAMLTFGLFEQWPNRLPRWLARWVLQVLGVALIIPIVTTAIYVLSTPPGAPPFNQVPKRMAGFTAMTMVGLLIAPWAALTALVRQKDALARHQALSFELERTQLERQALDARLSLLQAQVAPHFLFNTLANVQALVDAGSPRASDVLGSLIAYLRAAVPRLNDPATTLGEETRLVQAYLELMHMRMPDRLQFAMHVDETARALRCPPMTLLTLVENAVRHGVDPSEEGGRIEVQVLRRDGRCVVRVSDTGVGPRLAAEGQGTGLTTLRERLQLAFGGDAQLRLSAMSPHGACAELEFPAQATAG